MSVFRCFLAVLATTVSAVDAASVLQVSRPAEDGTYSDGDQAVKGLLEEMGHRVTMMGEAIDPAKAEGMDLVFVTETISAAEIGTLYRDVPVPCIVSDAHVFPGMGMTGEVENTDFGFSQKRNGDHRFIKIVGPAHPMIRHQFAGVIEVFDVPVSLHFGRPGPAAHVVAVPPRTTDEALLFTYEKGAPMPGGPAPARRVGLFVRDHHDDAAHLTPTGRKLLAAVVAWALSDASQD